VLEKLPVEFGNALRNQRAGIQSAAYYRLLEARKVPRIGISSTAFGSTERIPTRCTADGEGISPHIEWFGIPDNTASIVLLVEDGDSPTPHPFVHAIVVNLDPACRSLPEGIMNVGDDDMPNEIDLGINSLLKRGWLPPDPPPGHGEHHYAFQIFALDKGAKLPSSVGRHEVVETIFDRALAAGCLIGTYERPRRIVANESANDGIVIGSRFTPAAT
jgi:Raf kinase inhibitor-like YbhB/YbcL family protein